MIDHIKVARAVDMYFFESGDYSSDSMDRFFDRLFSHFNDRRRRQMVTMCKTAAVIDHVKMELSDDLAAPGEACGCAQKNGRPPRTV